VTIASAKHSKSRSRSVSRSRASKPARSAHATTAVPKTTHRPAPAVRAPQKRNPGHAGPLRAVALSPRGRREPMPSPMPMRHVAPPRPAVVAPARSMPPPREIRKLTPAPARGPLVAPEFTEAGVMLAITYSIREGRRGEFFDLMRELKPLLAGIGGTDCTIYEDRTRPNYFNEVFRFKDEAEFTAFDDKFHKDRKIAAIYALLDDIVEAEKSDFKIFERRL
jgi:hypothetical protein